MTRLILPVNARSRLKILGLIALCCIGIETTTSAGMIPVSGRGGNVTAGVISPGIPTVKQTAYQYERASAGSTYAVSRVDRDQRETSGRVSFGIRTSVGNDSDSAGGAIGDSTLVLNFQQPQQLIKYRWSAGGRGLILQTPSGGKNIDESGVKFGSGSSSSFLSFFFADGYLGFRNFSHTSFGVIEYALVGEHFIGESITNPGQWHTAVPGTQPVDVTGGYLAPVTSDLGVLKPIFVASAVTPTPAFTASLSAQSDPIQSVERYLFESRLNPITSLTLPEGFGSLTLEYERGTEILNAGETFSFGGSEVTKFSLFPTRQSGLPIDELAPYTLGFTFLNEGIADLQQTVVTTSAQPIPEPSGVILCSIEIACCIARRLTKNRDEK